MGKLLSALLAIAALVSCGRSSTEEALNNREKKIVKLAQGNLVDVWVPVELKAGDTICVEYSVPVQKYQYKHYCTSESETAVIVR